MGEAGYLRLSTMSHVIFAVDNADADAVQALYEDDLVGRQSITVREASAIGREGDHRYVLVEGSDDALDKAADLLGDAGETVGDEEAAEVFEAIKAGEEAGAEGMGFMFGG